MTGAEISVLIPTVGRLEMLRACLDSVLACEPSAAEVVVVDQSGGSEVEVMIAGLDDDRVVHVPCDGRGTARSMNVGLAAAVHDVVAVTHDDCTVRADWVGVADDLAHQYPHAILTGRVLAPDNSAYVPSTKDDPEPKDFTGTVTSGVLYPANMVAWRGDLVAIGGFDERPSMRVAEDNDLCYRWLRDGRPFRYEPSLVVLHHDWRTPDELVRTHIAYAHSQGAFYAKHLRAGDRQVLAMLRWDLRHGLRSLYRGARRGTPRWQDPYREMVLSLLVGVVRGWREDRALSSHPR
jgi:GT2 family glycosyltransferase